MVIVRQVHIKGTMTVSHQRVRYKNKHWKHVCGTQMVIGMSELIYNEIWDAYNIPIKVVERSAS